jgi:hypothetical protein
MTNSIKQDYISYRINSARETLAAARLLAENKHWNLAVDSFRKSIRDCSKKLARSPARFWG